VHQRGVTASPGLYFLGMPWQHTRGSALLGWVKDDAQHIADHIATLASTGTSPPAPALAAEPPSRRTDDHAHGQTAAGTGPTPLPVAVTSTTEGREPNA
jgi:putative flavoprotein involved in K+ transport